jgi:hypothetical protein
MVSLLKGDTEIYKQFVQRESFHRFVTGMVFPLTTEQATTHGATCRTVLASVVKGRATLLRSHRSPRRLGWSLALPFPAVTYVVRQTVPSERGQGIHSSLTLFIKIDIYTFRLNATLD